MPDSAAPAQRSLHILSSYLDQKNERRSDTSRLAKPYIFKTMLARLSHKCIERIETSLADTDPKKINYYKKLRWFLGEIWYESNLIEKGQVKKEDDHIEHFVWSIMKLCSRQEYFLIARQSQPITLAEWVRNLNKELSGLHILGIRNFHYLIQGKKIRPQLVENLESLGNTYRRIMQAQDRKATKPGEGLSFKISVESRKYWEKISKRAKGNSTKKLENHDHKNIHIQRNSRSLSSPISERTTLEETLFKKIRGSL